MILPTLCIAAFRASVAKTRAANTADTYAQAARHFHEFLSAQTPPGDLAALPKGTLAAFVEWLSARGDEPPTIATYNIGLRRYLEWLGRTPQEKGGEPRVPGLDFFARPSLPRIRIKESDALRGAQITIYVELAAEYAEPYATGLALLPATGLRISELSRLTANDLYYAPWPGGAHGKCPWFRIVDAKSKRDRSVPLLTQATPLFAHYLRDIRPALGGGRWIFPGRSGHRLSVRTCQEKVAALGEKMGIPLTPHKLRHTYITMLIEAGVPLPIVQRIVGHESILTTQRYVHPSQEAIMNSLAGVGAGIYRR